MKKHMNKFALIAAIASFGLLTGCGQKADYSSGSSSGQSQMQMQERSQEDNGSSSSSCGTCNRCGKDSSCCGC